ncbi:MAG: hypothetical protein IJX89_01930 [Alphaproteobacteria bacterium]|nr:hypothetical protein [Alphaproteobacteria bacterium]
MQLTQISNPDPSQSLAYRVARLVYAETGASSLHVAEALTSMIANRARGTGVEIESLIVNSELFTALNPDSVFHSRLSVKPSNRGFQMCLRVARRMLMGTLPDCCFGATKFHHTDSIPDWATALGYIDDVDGILFYL